MSVRTRRADAENEALAPPTAAMVRLATLLTDNPLTLGARSVNPSSTDSRHLSTLAHGRTG